MDKPQNNNESNDSILSDIEKLKNESLDSIKKQTQTEIKNLSSQAQEILSDVDGKITQSVEQIFNSKQQEIQNLTKSISDLSSKVEEQSNLLNEYSSSFGSVEKKTLDFIDNTKNEIKKYNTEVQEILNESQNNSDDISKLKSAINDQYNAIFGHTITTRKYIADESEEEVKEKDDGSLEFEGKKVFQSKSQEANKNYYYLESEKKRRSSR